MDETPMTDKSDEPRRTPSKHRQDDAGAGLPLWLRASVIAALAATLIAHIFIDVFLDTYEGAGTSFMLGGIVGTALGLNEFLKGRGE